MLRFMTRKPSTDLQRAANALDALGHHARLDIFRLLVRVGGDGMNVGDIAQRLEIAPSTLAYHLKTLVDADLLLQERNGRQMVNRVNFETMNQTVSFLTSECCSDTGDTRRSVA